MSEKRRVLVTGGSSGIGRCIAETFARDGFDVGIFDRSSPDDARPVVERIESFGRRAWVRRGDVREASQVHDAVESMAGVFGGIDVLVNNAGIFRDQVLWKMSDEAWRDVLDVDLTGVFHCCRAVVPVMRKKGWGAIINIASINALRGKFGQTNYAAAKAGVIGLTKSLAREVANFRITVNAVAPGMIDTPILEAMPQESKERSLEEIPWGRMGRVEDVAELVSFLGSERARFITGEVIRVDGGQYI